MDNYNSSRNLDQAWNSGAKQQSFRSAQAAATALTETLRPALQPLAQLMSAALTSMAQRGEEGLEGYDLEAGGAFNKALGLIEDAHLKTGRLYNNGVVAGSEIWAREVEAAARVIAHLLASEAAQELFAAEVAELKGWCDATTRAVERRAALDAELQAAAAGQRLIDLEASKTAADIEREARMEGFILRLTHDGQIEVEGEGSLSPVLRALINAKHDAIVELLKSRPTRRETLAAMNGGVA